MTGRILRLDHPGRSPVSFEHDGDYCWHVDYSELVIGPESFEIWSLTRRARSA